MGRPDGFFAIGILTDLPVPRLCGFPDFPTFRRLDFAPPFIIIF